MPFRDRSFLNRICYGFAEASSSHSFGQGWRWVGMLCPSWAVGTEWLAISGYSGLLRVSWLELYCYTCNFPLTSNCRSVLLVKKNIVLFANSIICILDHCEKTTKWKWFKGKHFFSETFQVWYTAHPSQLSCAGSQSGITLSAICSCQLHVPRWNHKKLWWMYMLPFIFFLHMF